MDKEKKRIGDAMILLYEEYKKAKNMKHVQKPISYALYQTWQFYDRIEKKKKDPEIETWIK